MPRIYYKVSMNYIVFCINVMFALIAGHIVPPLAKFIIDKNQGSPNIKINLRNILLYCPWSDPGTLTNYGPYLNGVGLIDEKTLNHFQDEHVAITELISSEDYAGAKKVNIP